MKPTEEELQKIKVAATLDGTLDEYVYLCEDEQGMYVKYAFKEGAPHDNRCLSWYDSYQENAYIRNGWFSSCTDEEREKCLEIIKKKRMERVGGLFEISSFTCGYEEHQEERIKESEKNWALLHDGDEPFVPEDHICKVGKPARCCLDSHCKHWTYKEPVKCACWVLREPIVPRRVFVDIDFAIKHFNELKQYDGKA